MAANSGPRVVPDGRFFRLGSGRFYVKGIAYGPLQPDAQGQSFASPAQSARDLDQVSQLGANLVRVYHAPPRWFLDLAGERRLKVLVGIPWNKHLCFDSPGRRDEARQAVRRAVSECARHPAVFAFSVGNEIPPDIVRWSGARQIEIFIDELVAEAKAADPECLCTYTNFPPTEFLRPRGLDFISFNVYLHDQLPFRRYLARLQMMAGPKPLLLGECGVDSLREGEPRKSRMLSWQIEESFRGGLAGAVVFTFTDEWFKDGRLVPDWQMGLVTAERQPKESFFAVQKIFAAAPHLPLRRWPKISVVVAAYNAERTLKLCLDSLRRLHYSDYEIILVDDGSTDTTPQIAAAFEADHGPPGPGPSAQAAPPFRYLRHKRNLGLSAARNTGIAAARGEIVAFTDADCRVDEDWLYYLAGSLLDSEFAGVGGPNLLPPEDSPVAAAVMVSPGGPAHVMLTDREAEHIPGCNMAFYKWALEEVGGFDPLFTRAGDDVDICWRLQQSGRKIGFSPSAFVWHFRRPSVRAYLKQQRGYGQAEALLVRKHPENFNSFGGGLWRGRIYAPSKPGVELRPPVIYHGLFGSAGFQKIYAPQPATTLMLCTAPEYHLFVMLPLWVLSSLSRYFLPLALVSTLLPAGLCALAGAQAELPKIKTRWWSRPLVASLFFLQPLVRGWARYRGQLAAHPGAIASQESLESVGRFRSDEPLGEVQYWAARRIQRLEWVAAILRRLEERGWPAKSDAGWSEYDVEILGPRWSRLQLTAVAEDHAEGRQLVRCRLRSTTSPAARAIVWMLLALDVLVIGLAGAHRGWPWLSFLVLPLFAWLVSRERRRLQSIASVFLDELARDHGLTRIPPGQ